MSSDRYTDIDVFTVKVPEGCLSTNGAGLLAEDDGIAVIVMSQMGSVRDVPFSPRWTISFIGSVAEFNNEFIDDEAYYFDDGLAHSDTLKNGNDYRSLIAALFLNAEPLSFEDMVSRGYEAYGWSDEEYRLLASKDGDVQYRKTYGDEGVATKIKSDADIVSMVVESGIIKELAKNDKYRVRAGRPINITSWDIRNARESAA